MCSLWFLRYRQVLCICKSSTLSFSMFASCVKHHRTIVYLHNPYHRLISGNRYFSVKKVEEKRLERLFSLRSVVVDHYSRQNESNKDCTIDWTAIQRDLNQQRLNFHSNFEFALLSAFSVPKSDSENEFELDKGLFQSIASFVLASPAVNSNKIAAIRFCRFLATCPQFLDAAQKVFIRNVAQRILEDNIQVSAIILDVISSLSSSSRENVRFALEIHEQLLHIDFALRIQVLNIIFQGLVQHGLAEEMLQFARRYHKLLSPDFALIGAIVGLLAKKNTFSEQPAKTLETLCLLSICQFSLVDVRFKNALIERILTRKLGYTKIVSTHISNSGRCACCGEQLSGISAAEHAELKANFRRIIFDKNDEYLILNLPEHEVQLYEFEELISNHSKNATKPKYDLVIDGLNISYRKAAALVPDRTGLRTYSKVYKVKDLDTQIVRILQSNHTFERFRRSLLIGRDHMKQWYGLNRLIRQKHSLLDHCFLLNRTRDDNYILYAAVQHPETRILSGDYFRDHREKFKEWYLKSSNTGRERMDEESANSMLIDRPNLPQIFARWLRQRQIRIGDDHRFVEPNQFDMRIHIGQDTSDNDTDRPCLHIAVVTKQDPHCNEDHEYEWICARNQKIES